jgi:hypothetical protein
MGARRRAGPSYAPLRPDPSYNFTVDVVNGNIGHPNILTFKGHVASSGAVRTSVRIAQKYASGSVRSPEELAEASGVAARASRGVRQRGGAEELKGASRGVGSEKTPSSSFSCRTVARRLSASRSSKT